MTVSGRKRYNTGVRAGTAHCLDPMPATFYVTSVVHQWNRLWDDYDQIDLEHFSKAATAEEAEQDAREVWSGHGYNPERVTVSLNK